MISHANLNSGQSGNYYRQDDYYKSEDEGFWTGRLAEQKGLTGEIRQEDFDGLARLRGTRQGYDIQLGIEKSFAGAAAEAAAAHALGVEAVRSYLASTAIQRAGELRLEATRTGTQISLLNRSRLSPEGFRTYDANEDFLQHREPIERIYREAVRGRLGQDAGKCGIKSHAVAQVAYDFTLSAPKSGSIAMAQGGQAEADMRACHRAAVEETRQYLERHVEARLKENDVIRHERTGNMLCGRFTHQVSRNQDPQLHTHLVIFNLTRCADGRERAIDNNSLVTNKFHFDLVYKAQLARLLQERGYEVRADHQKGTFELKEIGRPQIEAFSSRRAEILEKIQAWGKDPAGANREMRDAACQLTREAKRNCDMAKLRESWRETLKENGVGPVRALAGPAGPDKSKEAVFRETGQAISGQTFAFQRKEFLDEALKRGLGRGVIRQDAERHFDERQGKDFLYLGQKDGKDYYCTPESYKPEQAIFRHVEEGRGRAEGIDRATVDASLANGTTLPEGKTIELSEEQKNAVRHISTTADRFSAVQGLAGTGKTTMLNQAREIYESHGYQVKGVCFTGKAAEGLEREAGIRSVTIHAHLNALEKEAGRTGPAPSLEQRSQEGWQLEGLKPAGREVWIVDEASMVNNRLMVQLQEAALAKDAKVILTGDAKQLQPIGAGNAFTNLVERNRIAYAVMQDIQRQRDPNLGRRDDPGHESFPLRQAVRDSVLGRVQDALDKLANRTWQIEDRPERLGRMARDYAALDRRERRETVLVTGTNADRQELNERVRAGLKERGELRDGRSYGTADGRREFAAGDKLIFLKNDRELGVKNGQPGTVKKLGEDRLTVAIGRGRGQRTVDVDLARYDHVDHGYCLTAHKAQGITADRALIHIDTGQQGVNSRNAFYVDVSRARHEVRIYTDDRERLAASVERWQSKLSSDDFPDRPPSLELAARADPPGTAAEKLDQALSRPNLLDTELYRQPNPCTLFHAVAREIDRFANILQKEMEMGF